MQLRSAEWRSLCKQASRLNRAFQSLCMLLAFTAAGFAQIGVFGGVQGGMNATLSGIGAPSNSLGIDGDLYIDTTSGAPKLYGPKASGTWPPGIPLGGSDTTVCNAASSSALGCLMIPPSSGLTVDANGNLSVTPGAFLGDPGANGLVVRTAAGATAIAKASDLPAGYSYSNLSNAPVLGSAAALAADNLLTDPGANGLVKRTGPGTTAPASVNDLPSGYPYGSLSNPPTIPTDVSSLTDTTGRFVATATATPPSSLLSISNGALLADRSDPAMAAFDVCFHNYTTRYCNVALIGDSWTEGGGTVASASNYWAVQLQRYLQANSFYHGAGIIPVHTSSGAWVWGGSTYSSTNMPPTVNALGPNQVVSGNTAATFGTLYQLSGTANTLTLGTYSYSSNPTGSRFYADTYLVYYATSTDTAAGFTVTVSNTASSGTVTTSTPVTCGATTTAAYTPAVCTISAPSVSGTPLNWDTLTITPPATGNAYIYGVEPVVLNNPVAPLAVNNYTNVGISVDNFGRGGATSNAFGSSPATQLAFLPEVYGGQIELAVVSLGLNDWAQGVALSTYQTNLQNIVSYLQTTFPAISILLLDQGNVDPTKYSNANGNTQAQFRAIEKAVATAYGCGFLSVSERWGTFANANTHLQIMGPDGLHPTDAGYIDIAQMIERRIVEQTLAFTQLYPGQTQISGNQTHNANFETSSTYLGQNAGGSGNSGNSGYNTGIGQNACSNLTTGHNNVCLGQYAPGPTTGSNDVLLGSNSKVGNSVSGSVQLGAGTNGTSNTGQFENWNFIDSSGYLYAKALLLPAASIGTAATVALTSGLNHLTGATTVNTLTPPSSVVSGSGAAGTTFTGCVKVIADSGFSTSTGGNIFAAYTLVAGKMYDACFDGNKWYFAGSGI